MSLLAHRSKFVSRQFHRRRSSNPRLPVMQDCYHRRSMVKRKIVEPILTLPFPWLAMSRKRCKTRKTIRSSCLTSLSNYALLSFAGSVGSFRNYLHCFGIAPEFDQELRRECPCPTASFSSLPRPPFLPPDFATNKRGDRSPALCLQSVCAIVPAVARPVRSFAAESGH